MSGNKVLELKKISKSFGTRKIIDKLDLSLVLVGCVYLAMTAVLTALLRVVEKKSNVWK